MTRRGVLCGAALVVVTCMVAVPVSAQVLKQDVGFLDGLAKVDERIASDPAAALIDDVQGLIASDVTDGWAAFQLDHGDWVGYADQRTGRLGYAEGAGIPWVPGRGNGLTQADLGRHLGSRSQVDLAAVESIARDFLPQVAGMLGVDPASLVLNPGRSGDRGGYLWFVDFDVLHNGLVVEGARVVFRVNNGNLIQFGSENLPAPGAAAPKARIDRAGAMAALARYIGGVYPTDDFLDHGTLKLFPANQRDDSFAEGYEIANGRGLLTAWELIFRREGDHSTWRARIDAVTGEVLELADTNLYAQATGGVYLIAPPTSTIMPMPFADVTASTFANSAGVFSTGTDSNLFAQYVRISDNCGSINEPVSGGNIGFGTSTGDDCTTPGHGGAGNTHSSRTQFYHLNRIKEVGRGWLPTNSWLNAALTANVNINLNCNAFWNGSTVNFYRSGGGCGNTGELPGVSLHEYGHGLDSNDGNGSANHDQGTGETYGDFTAALQLHQSCIGSGFLGGNCSGYGDACTSCTGVRDIDWGKHVSNTPHTVANFTQPRCPTHATYRGPCGREGHCESYISSEALWDLAARDLPNPGSGAAWSVVDRLWYLSRSTATAAFVCTASGTWSSHGCATGTLWRTMRAVDDDDGNLSNGTPHGGALFAAFNRHGVACTTDAGASTTFRGCTPPATPSLTLTPGSNSMGLSWTNSGSGVVYDLYRGELGCNAGFTKIANNVSGTSFTDNAVANGFAYNYQVVAHPSATEACGGNPSVCQTATPSGGTCTPPSAPSGLSATAVSQTQVNLSWGSVTGASSYNVYRSTTSGGPYTQIASGVTGTSYSDTSASCNTQHFYVVRAFNGCESGNSNQASATTSACTGCTTSTLYSHNFQSGSGLVGWTRGSFGGSGSVVSWRGRQTCSGAGIFRYGGSSCTGNYSSNNFNFARPPAISVPSGSSQTTLIFQHRRAFETGFDGGTLAVSTDGTNYTLVPASAITGTTYNGTVAPDCAPSGSAGIPIYTGTQTSYTSTTVNLESVCTLIGGGGCAGQPLYIAFTAVTDCSVTGDGWFLDNVSVTSCTP